MEVATWVDAETQSAVLSLPSVGLDDHGIWFRARVWVEDTSTSTIVDEVYSAGAMLAVVVNPLRIFSDGFESGDILAWSFED